MGLLADQERVAAEWRSALKQRPLKQRPLFVPAGVDPVAFAAEWRHTAAATPVEVTFEVHKRGAYDDHRRTECHPEYCGLEPLQVADL